MQIFYKQSTCSRVIGPDRQPYTVTQEELPSANILLMGYSISFWIKVDTAENYTNRYYALLRIPIIAVM